MYYVYKYLMLGQILLSSIASIIIIRRLVTLAEHTSDHGKQTNSSTKEKGEQG